MAERRCIARGDALRGLEEAGAVRDVLLLLLLLLLLLRSGVSNGDRPRLLSGVARGDRLRLDDEENKLRGDKFRLAWWSGLGSGCFSGLLRRSMAFGGG